MQPPGERATQGADDQASVPAASYERLGQGSFKETILGTHSHVCQVLSYSSKSFPDRY